MIYEKYKNISPDEFVDIPGYEGYYQINKNQQIRRLDRTVITKRNVVKKLKETIIYPTPASNDYLNICLTGRTLKKVYGVHVLMALTFLHNPEKYKLVRHLNDVKTDNRIDNLAWGTFSDNALDAIRNGKSMVRYGSETSYYGRKGELSEKSKIILDTQTGVFYFGTEEAAVAKGIKSHTLSAKLNGYLKNNTFLIRV